MIRPVVNCVCKFIAFFPPEYFHLLPIFTFCTFFSLPTRYEFKLELPHLPEMVFSQNKLVLTHKNGGQIEFNPLDALAKVRNGKSSIRVACADEWKSSRSDTDCMEEVKPFDWSFSTDYQGTFNEKIRCEDTDAKLDIFKLMQKEKILFYQDLTLFEDELHDHGIAACSVKIVSYTFGC